MCWKLCVEPKATKRTPRRYSRCPFVHYDICSTSTGCADSRRRCVMSDARLIRSRDVEQQTRNRGDELKTTLNLTTANKQLAREAAKPPNRNSGCAYISRRL